MSTSRSVFSETLQSITTTKLTEISKKYNTFEEQKASLLKVAQVEADEKERLRLLLNGVKQCFGVKTVRKKGGSAGHNIVGINNSQLEVLLKNLERFLEQSRYDPSVSAKLLHDWERSLLQQLDVQSLKFEYGTLYGRLVNVWLSAEQVSTGPITIPESQEDFEKIGGDGRDEQRVEWERLVFDPFETDQTAIGKYLQALFSNNGTNKQSLQALETLRKKVDDFGNTLAAPGQFNEYVLKWTINGLLASNLLKDEKRAVLKDFLASPVI